MIMLKYFFFLSSKSKNYFSLNSCTGDCQMIFLCDFLGPKMKSVILKQACGRFFKKKWEPVINISWLKNEQVKLCFFTLESPYPYF